jgi:hypothetical protein
VRTCLDSPGRLNPKLYLDEGQGVPPESSGPSKEWLEAAPRDSRQPALQKRRGHPEWAVNSNLLGCELSGKAVDYYLLLRLEQALK